MKAVKIINPTPAHIMRCCALENRVQNRRIRKILLLFLILNVKAIGQNIEHFPRHRRQRWAVIALNVHGLDPK